MTTALLAVSGTLIRSLEFSPSMQKTGGIFIREDRTDARYRLWGINNRHPGMARVNEGGTHVDIEIWQLPLTSSAALSMNEPTGPTIGKIKLTSGNEMPSVLVENWLAENQREITELSS